MTNGPCYSSDEEDSSTNKTKKSNHDFVGASKDTSDTEASEDNVTQGNGEWTMDKQKSSGSGLYAGRNIN